MSFLDKKDLPGNIELAGWAEVEIKNFSSIRQIKKTIIDAVFGLYKKCNIESVEDDFETGLFFVSDYLYNRVMSNADASFKRDGGLFFDPMKFTGSILNSFTHDISEKFKIRGYSNSFIKTGFDNLLNEFMLTSLSKALFIAVNRNSSRITAEAFVLKK